MPTKQALERKVAQMGKLVSQPMTEVGFNFKFVGSLDTLIKFPLRQI